MESQNLLLTGMQIQKGLSGKHKIKRSSMAQQQQYRKESVSSKIYWMQPQRFRGMDIHPIPPRHALEEPRKRTKQLAT